MGDLLGRNCVYSRKPTPAFLSGANPNWQLAKNDMCQTRAATKNGQLDILSGDLYDVNHDRARLKEWVAMTKSVFNM